jgi:multidrug efflux pump subunit AcrB
VPVLQLGLSGNGLTEQQLNDFGTNFIRTQLATVQGASMPYPYGGKQRQVQVDIDTQKLQAYGLSAADVVNAVGTQNIILPAGDVKMGHVDYQVETNSAPESIEGAERSAHQDRERRHHLYSRRRQCARRLSRRRPTSCASTASAPR